MSRKSSPKPRPRSRPGKSTPKRLKKPKRKPVVKTSDRHKARKIRLRDMPLALDHARRLFMVTRSVKSAARSTGVSESRLRRLIRNYKLARWDRKRRKWRITDRATREVGIASNGKARTIVVRGFARAQLAKGYTAAVKRFLETNDVSALAPYEAVSIADINKKEYVLETRPNVLLRLANTGSDADMKIYRLID
jgi:hypothetical protein